MTRKHKIKINWKKLENITIEQLAQSFDSIKVYRKNEKSSKYIVLDCMKSPHYDKMYQIKIHQTKITSVNMRVVDINRPLDIVELFGKHLFTMISPPYHVCDITKETFVKNNNYNIQANTKILELYNLIFKKINHEP